MWGKKKAAPPAPMVEEKEASLLKTLCGDKPELYEVASGFLCVNPMTAISPKPLETLMKEAEKQGDYRLALDKAIFEAAQNPGETARYMALIQDITLRTITAKEREKADLEKQGLADRAAFLAKKIEIQKIMNQRAGEILDIAARYYKERLLELGKDAQREALVAETKELERVEWRAHREEEATREVRRREIKQMDRADRKEAERQDKLADQAAEAKKESRE